MKKSADRFYCLRKDIWQLQNFPRYEAHKALNFASSLSAIHTSHSLGLCHRPLKIHLLTNFLWILPPGDLATASSAFDSLILVPQDFTKKTQACHRYRAELAINAETLGITLVRCAIY